MTTASLQHRVVPAPPSASWTRYATAVGRARQARAALDDVAGATPVGALVGALLAGLAADRAGVEVPPDVRSTLGAREASAGAA